jgi:RNA polymerase sigma factor (sigma-70 family)
MLTSAQVAGVRSTVEMFARRYSRFARGHFDFDDLCQVGYVAAMKAAPSFDPNRGASFATFCRMPIRTAMRCAVAGWRKPMLSLDAPVHADSESTYLDGLESECATPEAALEAAEREALVKGIVARAVAEFEQHREMATLLVERLMEGEMVEQRFRSEVSLAEIAEKFSVTRQWVCTVEKRLRTRLAEALAEAA